MQVIVLYCLLCSSLCLSLQEYSRPYVYVYVHRAGTGHAPWWNKPRTRSRNTRPSPKP